MAAGNSNISLGCVSFLNAKPLIYGLEEARGLELSLDVPSALLSGLVRQRFDVALLPVIDYQRLPGLRLLTSGGIGCDGPTLTVRIFSSVDVTQIERLECDSDSHTSIALARVILAERFGIRPRFAPLSPGPLAHGAARLLIGDKVVCEEPRDLPFQIDLGQAWKELTGLPFLFAAWMARAGVDLRDLPGQLDIARVGGLQHVEEIISRYAIPRGWPAAVAHKYLTQYLQFEVGPRQLQAVRLFHELAFRHQVLDAPPRPLEII